MAPNVAFDDGYEVDAVLDNWRSRLVHHEKIQVRLVRLEQGPGNLLLAYLIISEVIPRKALLHCLGDEAPEFAWKLLGLELEVPTCVHFRWDEQERRFVSVHYEADMLTPLLKLLGNLEDASAVLNSPLGID
ncbi:hypothetical protein V7S43_015746 [Phytophthora oleae]|uniref:Uncharacterized protein n=1 Tax=Phytophthora oleae TaxID=2107226 RepID=A0ABD3EZN4_9STRA